MEFSHHYFMIIQDNLIKYILVYSIVQKYKIEANSLKKNMYIYIYICAHDHLKICTPEGVQ